MAFPKIFLNVAVSKNPDLHICFGLNVNRGLNKTNVLLPSVFSTKTFFLHNNVLYTNTMFYTKAMFLLGLCKGCLRLAG